VQLASPAGESLAQRRSASVPRGVGNTHPIFVERAHGSRVVDVDGREYFDFVGGIGVLNLGHTHPKIVEAIARQAERYTHTCFQVAMYEPYVAVAEALNRLAPGPSPKKTLLLTTGSEATENAIKIAREYTRRPAVISFQYGYHGRTLLALSMTGKNAPYKQHFGPFCSEIYHAPFPNEYHGWSTERALASLHELFSAHVSPDRVAAIIIEPVLGEGGFVPAPPAFLQALRRIADAHGILLVCDEIQTGFGRTGRMFAIEHAGVEPDLITVAKSIAGGLPLSAVIGKSEIMDAPEAGGLGGTYAGNPLACAAALASFDIMDDAFLARARTIGERLFAALHALKARYPQIGDVRGLGAMVGMELLPAADGGSYGQAIVDAARERGLLLMLAGRGDVIRILVPLVIDDRDLDAALARLAASCDAILSAEVKQNS
jgi:4-aminobutyrate aminotransferase/(S)-3-amino-2-methylpropionate transaminase